MSEIVHFETITQAIEAFGLPQPKHPLICLMQINKPIANLDFGNATYVFGFYQISLKANLCGTMLYGRNTYDFQQGTVIFTKPGQAMSFQASDEEYTPGGWSLLFHPDLIRRSELGKSIEQYSFFSYESHEALHLSDEERNSLTEIALKIATEYSQTIDRYTQKLIISNLELLLDYCTRYYDRQFYVRTNLNQDIATRFENLLKDYFDSEQSLESGLPTVKYCGQQLNMSSPYLSDLLKKETGCTAQQHIQNTIIDRAKTQLLATNEQISQIAYGLGFEYPQHFSKMFKAHTGMSPAEYRQVK